jgi:hypothetical protein
LAAKQRRLSTVAQRRDAAPWGQCRCPIALGGCTAACPDNPRENGLEVKRKTAEETRMGEKVEVVGMPKGQEDNQSRIKATSFKPNMPENKPTSAYPAPHVPALLQPGLALTSATKSTCHNTYTSAA